jgi:hypothetical protein
MGIQITGHGSAGTGGTDGGRGICNLAAAVAHPSPARAAAEATVIGAGYGKQYY